ncbi:hypothetical protein DPSP01_004909 [Paraphaeosphaeria sporulosa]|uniref:Carboxymuconolactone decarboxylase-like domain-containing protein n=1 Tax=Paraphaeosphaeria sporulosa TaxID=1460663 RepID=A0A177C912_9PLEO|nr:uncharacterized protein CC84DRAFT_963765 [Paraphaeosphaeria sporulosa]OAG03247.1 hypothetical protein CC84DRAFT_963765 [Paraphaeosphaeria sporulosa]
MDSERIPAATRFPTVPPASLSAAQKPVHDHVTSVSQYVFGDNPPFAWADGEGSLIGPYTSMLYAPTIGTAFFDHAIKVGTDQRLPIRVKEIAILAVGGHFQAAYENYAHARLAKLCGLSDEQVASALAGRDPIQGLADAEITAYRLALAMVSGKGPVSEEIWSQVRRYFGQEESAVLVFLISSYAYIAMVLNAGAVPAPATATATA